MNDTRFVGCIESGGHLAENRKRFGLVHGAASPNGRFQRFPGQEFHGQEENGAATRVFVACEIVDFANVGMGDFTREGDLAL